MKGRETNRKNSLKHYIGLRGKQPHQLDPHVKCQSYANNQLKEMTPQINWNTGAVDTHLDLIHRRRLMFAFDPTEAGLKIFTNREFLTLDMFSGDRLHPDKNEVVLKDRQWVEKNFPKEILLALKNDEVDLYISHGEEGWRNIDFESLCKIFFIKPSQLVWVTRIYNVFGNAPMTNNSGVRVVFDNFWERHLNINSTPVDEENFQEQIRRIEAGESRTMLATLYARRVRPPRAVMLTKMHELNLLDKLYWSYGISIEGANAKEYNIFLEEDLRKFLSNDNRVEDDRSIISSESIDWVCSLTENQYADDHKLEDNLAHGYITWNHVHNTKMMIINETMPNENVGMNVYSDVLGPFLSEKSYKPFATGQPFVMWGDRHTIAALENEGYRCFREWIDHGYDNAGKFSTRFFQLTKEIQRLSELSEEEWTNMLIEMLPDIEHNRKLFLSIRDTNDPNNLRPY